MVEPRALTAWVLDCDRRPALAAAATAVVLATAYLASPLMGGDLSAQMARSDFASSHPSALIDFRWFGGTLPYGYSLWVPIVMSWIGVRLTGAIAAVAASVLAARLLQRAGARRPVVGGVAAAVCQASDLAEGRVAFAMGMVFGLAALLTLTGDRIPVGRRRSLTAFAALVAGAASPVAALLIWLCGGVAVLQRRYVDAAVLVIASALPVVVIDGVFGDGGSQVFNPTDAIRAVLVTIFAGIVIPSRCKAIRLGAALGVVLVVAAYVLPTPVGGNATRLSLLFAVPIVAAFAEWRWWRAAIAVAVAFGLQTPVTIGTLTGAGAPATQAAYFSPVLDEIHARGALTGRVEIPELTGHWEAVYAARSVPLARGWLRQVDTELNGAAFYDHAPTTATYRAFLDRSAVQYVAVSDARPTFFGRREMSLIDKNLPYLKDVWHNEHWTLYAVDPATPIVAAPARLVDYAAASVTIDAPANARILVRVRWLQNLDLSGTTTGCITRDGSDVLIRSTTAGRYVLTSSLRPAHQC